MRRIQDIESVCGARRNYLERLDGGRLLLRESHLIDTAHTHLLYIAQREPTFLNEVWYVKADEGIPSTTHEARIVSVLIQPSIGLYGLSVLHVQHMTEFVLENPIHVSVSRPISACVDPGISLTSTEVGQSAPCANRAHLIRQHIDTVLVEREIGPCRRRRMVGLGIDVRSITRRGNGDCKGSDNVSGETHRTKRVLLIQSVYAHSRLSEHDVIQLAVREMVWGRCRLQDITSVFWTPEAGVIVGRLIPVEGDDVEDGIQWLQSRRLPETLHGYGPDL